MPPLLLPSLHSLINTLLFLSLFFPTSLSSDAEGYAACAPYSCGKFNISYPFWSNSQPDYCGHPKFKLDCQQDNVIIVDILSQKFQVIDMNQRSQIMKIARLDLLGGDPCPKEYVNVNLDIAFFSTTSKDDNYTLLYDCDLNSYASPQANYNPAMGGFKFQCPIEGGDVQYGLLVLSTEVAEFNSLGCKNNISVPVLKGDEKDSLDVGSVIGEGFEVGWSGVDEVQCQGCIQSGGRCGHNASINAFMCLCANQQFHGGVNCIQSKGRSPNSPLQAPSPRPISTTTLSAPYAPIYPEQPHKAPKSECYKYSVCKEQLYNCGKLSNISYPFWGQSRDRQCGGGDPFKLNCLRDDATIIQTGSQNLQVIDIKPGMMSIMRRDLAHDVCSPQLEDTYMKPPLFSYPSSVQIISMFYDCPQMSSPYLLTFPCLPGTNYKNATYYKGEKGTALKTYSELGNCSGRLQVPATKPPPVDVNIEEYEFVTRLREALNNGFEVTYDVSPDCTKCLGRGGDCIWNSDIMKEHVNDCYYCPNGSSHCYPHKSTLNLPRKIGIGVGSAAFGALVAFIAFYYIRRRRKKSSYAGMSYIQSGSFSYDLSSKDTEKGSQIFAPGVHLFSYDELEEATNHFDSSRELGEGGFGTVYFGKLRDGRSIAVKRLFENNYRRVEQFMNEIKILARLVHPNLVSLYGCTSRHSRELLLVYEYIPNGTVADHLHGRRGKPKTLPWHIRMNIAVETASALKYLHVSDTIHRDVKTNNILLDSHFHVKVADFGLSRLFPDHVTHISTAPQGTPGYVDPEYHECYQLTSKSDVYSFGVVLIELISSLPAVDITRHRHEINLANMAINKIQNQALHELVDPTLGFESDFKVRKMINAVAELAFQCLQSSKDMRPSMEEVLDTLKDIKSDGKHKSQPEVMDMSSSTDDVVLLKDDPPPPSPDSNTVSKSTTPNASG